MKKKKSKLPKARKNAWFIPLRWSYLPASKQGWLLYIPYVLYLLVTLLFVSKSSNSVVGTLFGIVPFWVAGPTVMQWIASHKS